MIHSELQNAMIHFFGCFGGIEGGAAHVRRDGSQIDREREFDDGRLSENGRDAEAIALYEGIGAMNIHCRLSCAALSFAFTASRETATRSATACA